MYIGTETFHSYVAIVCFSSKVPLLFDKQGNDTLWHTKKQLAFARLLYKESGMVYVKQLIFECLSLKRRKVYVTKLSSENNLQIFQLNAQVITIGAKMK